MAGLSKTYFLENSVACEPLYTFLHSCGLAIHQDLTQKMLNEILDDLCLDRFLLRTYLSKKQMNPKSLN
jgi:hypothetical protein